MSQDPSQERLRAMLDAAREGPPPGRLQALEERLGPYLDTTPPGGGGTSGWAGLWKVAAAAGVLAVGIWGARLALLPAAGEAPEPLVEDTVEEIGGGGAPVAEGVTEGAAGSTPSVVATENERAEALAPRAGTPAGTHEEKTEAEMPEALAAGGAAGPEPMGVAGTGAERGTPEREGADRETAEAVEAEAVEAEAARSEHPFPSRRALQRRGIGEAELLARAQDAVRVDPAHTLRLAALHERHFRQGVLAQEREVLIIDALTRLGRNRLARRRADAFLRRHPDSAHRAGVEELMSRARGVE